MLLTRPNGLFISDDPARLDRARIRGWLADSYWAASRSSEQVERSLAHSQCFGVYAGDGEQLALTRVVTDRATFAWIGDVVVHPARRGQGLGRWLVGAVVADLQAQGVPRIVLATRDAHGVYDAIGFEPVRNPTFWMEIDTRPDPLAIGAGARPPKRQWPVNSAAAPRSVEA